MKWIKNIFLILVLVLGIAFIITPWKSLATMALHMAAARYGYPLASFTVDSVSPNHLALSEASLGPDQPIKFTKISFAFTPEELRESKLNIAEAEAIWEGGTVSAKDAKFSWAGDRLLIADISVNKVPLGNLMKLIANGKVTADGLVSGELPLIIYADKAIAIHKGYLRAEKPGVLTVAPELIPSDNAQVEVVREVMKNFHYSELSIELDSDKNKKLSMILQLQGNNPDAYNGREARLRIKLQGDLLSLLTQSIMSIIDPESFLKKGE